MGGGSVCEWVVGVWWVVVKLVSGRWVIERCVSLRDVCEGYACVCDACEHCRNVLGVHEWCESEWVGVLTSTQYNTHIIKTIENKTNGTHFKTTRTVNPTIRTDQKASSGDFLP